MTPDEIGMSTLALRLYVDDVEALFEREGSAGARIINLSEATDFGLGEYHARYLTDHL